MTAPIIGGRSLQQLQASLDSLKIDMTPALYAEFAALSRTPPPATDRLEEANRGGSPPGGRVSRVPLPAGHSAAFESLYRSRF